MPCYHPVHAYRTPEKKQLVFSEQAAKQYGGILSELDIPCGQCIGCRLERSRQWAIRCMHEAKMHRYNSFLTLTYNEKNLPAHGNLTKSHAVAFNKALLKALCKGRGAFLCATTSSKVHSRYGAPPHAPSFRFYLAGEYGETNLRPHFHICLFGVDFADKVYLTKTATGSKLYRSPTLERIWKKGFSSIGELNFESAAYAARYVMKKITGSRALSHYEKVDPDTGEIIRMQPEYNNMSRMPGIGKPWLDKYGKDAYPEGRIIIRGRKVHTPRYYDQQFKKHDPLGYEALEYSRQIDALAHAHDQRTERLQARERVAAAQLRQLRRKI